MSYFDYFLNSTVNQPERNSESISGTCYTMCPREEVEMREKERLVHILEVKGGTRKLVKCYSRSAADAQMAVPRLLRPYNTLKDTVQYLLLEVTERMDVSEKVVYEFVNDRLRAVRQDMTIQRLPAPECMNLLEPMIRFYIFYGYRLSTQSIKDYDPVLNNKYLLECLKWFLSCADTVEKEPSNTTEEFWRSVDKLNLNNDKYKLPSDRALIESVYILCNLHDIHPLYRYFGLPENMKNNQTVKLAYQIAISNLQRNYVRAFRLTSKLCAVTYKAVSLHFPTMQRQALLVMSHAYSSKQLSVPVEVIAKRLQLEEAAVVDICAHYGLNIKGSTVNFIKGAFKTDVPVHSPVKNFGNNLESRSLKSTMFCNSQCS